MARPSHPGPDAPPARTASAAARSRRLVHAIVRRHFGESARRVTELGGGLTNAVYRIKVSQGEFVVRTNQDATKINDYLKEQWAMDAARAVGVPTPKVLEVANFADGRPYMVSEHASGVEGRLASNRLDVLEQLGRAAASLHAVRTSGFGPVFDWSSNRLSKHATWRGYLAEGFDVETRLDALLKRRVIVSRQASWLRRTASEMSQWKKPGGLQHGDLRLKNVIVDPDTGRIAALVDWESCASMPGPAWDLSLALHELGVDEKEALLSGYGMAPRQFARWLPFMRCFNMLNYAHAVGSAAEAKNRVRLRWFRLRLAGALDLYER